MIKRDKYLMDLVDRMGNGLVKVITGIRRAGKSYLMNEIFYSYLKERGIDEKHIIRFAFDSADDLVKIGEDPLILDDEDKKVDPKLFVAYIAKNVDLTDGQTYYLLLDEVQKLGSFEAVLNGYLRKNNIDLYVTGSNSKFLSSDIRDEFEGRGDEIHVLPLSFSEFAPAYGGSDEEALDDYLVYGGLPLVALMKKDEQKTKWLMSTMEKTYVRDLVRRHHLQSDGPISSLLDVVASDIGGLVNPLKLSDSFQSVKKTSISEDTVAKYIWYMEEAFLVKKSLRYDVKGNDYLSTPYKLYFEDLGLRNARLSFRQVDENHLMENALFNELRYRGYEVDVGAVESRVVDAAKKETRKMLEIDFVANSGSRRYYIQSAFAMATSEKADSEYRPFKLIGDSFKKIVVVRDNIKPRRDENGYLTIGLLNFLEDPNSLDL
jgi:predicted AAA+ superfamily ATPase